MDSFDYASTSETTNVSRISRALFGPCTDQLRDVMRHRVPLSSFKRTIRRCKTLPLLTVDQKDLILPRKGDYNGDYSDMDISFLYVLLRNVSNLRPHSEGWGNIPDVNDSSPSANIERIHLIRNKVLHSSDIKVTDAEFESIWSDMTEAVKSMDLYLNNRGKYEDDLDFLLKETMDPEQENHYRRELDRMAEKDKQIREMLAKHQASSDGAIHELNEKLAKAQEKQVVLEDHFHDQRNQKVLMESQMNHLSRQIEQIKEDSIHLLNEQLKEEKKNREVLEYNLHEHRNEKFDMESRMNQLEAMVMERDGKIIALEHDLHTYQTGMSQLSARQALEMHEPQVDEHLVNRLKERLFEIYIDKSSKIPLTQVHGGGYTLPIDQIFVSVEIIEDTNRHFPPQDWAEQQEKRLDTLSDILSEYGKAVSHVLMLGDAGNGKTTYCIWLLKNWCNVQRLCLNERSLNEFEKAFLHIDFVFFIPLRHVHPSRSNVTDMICKDVFEMDAALGVTAMQILFSDNYRCLIIMDGLEEWKPDQSAKDNLKYKGMPNMDGMSNSVILTTSRPLQLLDVERSVRDKHRIIEILGIHDDGIESVINKILINLYRIEPDSNDYSRRYRKISRKLEIVTSRSFLKNPMLAVVCVQMWNEERQAEDIMTSFYSNIIDMLIERSLLKKELKNSEDEDLHIFIPKGLSGNEKIKAYLSPLSKLGRVALRTLLSKDKNSVYQHSRFVNELGSAALQFALDVGLISQTEAPSTDKKNVHVQFLHESLEEFLAAIHIVSSAKEREEFCRHLSNVKVIMELANVISFIYGMRPFLADAISQRVVSVTGTDIAIKEYKSTPQEGNDTVRDLLKIQIRWYREIMYGRTQTPVTKHPGELFSGLDLLFDMPLFGEHFLPFSYHVSVIHLCTLSDLETVETTQQLLSDENVSVSSLFVDIEEERFTNTELNKFLTDAYKTRSLTMIYISGVNTNRSLRFLCGSKVESLWLLNVTLDEPLHTERPVIKNMHRIQNLYLSNLRLNDRDVGLSARMTQLQTITLDRISMMSNAWLRFVQSLIDIEHQFYVKTRQTDICYTSVRTVRLSPEFRVTKDEIKRNGRYFDFKRVWPPTDADRACILREISNVINICGISLRKSLKEIHDETLFIINLMGNTSDQFHAENGTLNMINEKQVPLISPSLFIHTEDYKNVPSTKDIGRIYKIKLIKDEKEEDNSPSRKKTKKKIKEFIFSQKQLNTLLPYVTRDAQTLASIKEEILRKNNPIIIKSSKTKDNKKSSPNDDKTFSTIDSKESTSEDNKKSFTKDNQKSPTKDN